MADVRGVLRPGRVATFIVPTDRLGDSLVRPRHDGYTKRLAGLRIASEDGGTRILIVARRPR